MKYKISLVTVCYNSAKTIEHCLESVLSQTLKNFEYVIVDGNSTDDTLSIIKNYEKKFISAGISITVVSEPDNGLYDAMNKGIALAQGKWIWFINSDDFLEHNAIETSLQAITKNSEKYEIIYGQLVKISDRINYKIGQRSLSSKSKNVTFNHPSTVVKRSCFENYGKFNLEYKMCADYDFFTRLIKNNIRACYINTNLAYMREGGISDKLSSYIERGKEHFKIDYKHYGLKTAFFNSLSFYIIGMSKKIFKELLLKYNNSFFFKLYYNIKYISVGRN